MHDHLQLLSLLAGLLALAHTDRHRAPALALLRWQLGVVYAFAAASKINADFLSGRVIVENLPAALGRARRRSHSAVVLAAGAIAIEAFVAGCLLVTGGVRPASSPGVGLHLAFVLAVAQTIAMIAFAVICLSLYPLVSPRRRLTRARERDAISLDGDSADELDAAIDSSQTRGLIAPFDLVNMLPPATAYRDVKLAAPDHRAARARATP